MKVIEIPVAGSTNSWLAQRRGDFTEATLVYALEQTAGRGQRGNSWESAPGKNLTASAIFFPRGVEAEGQFAISEAVSLAVVDLLGRHGIEARVKWPNDIYVGDRKICGILIENSILGRNIQSSIAGIGLNVNQREFFSDAPNPVSMSRLSDKEYSIAELAAELAGLLAGRIDSVCGADADVDALHEEYMHTLWRGDAGGRYPFVDKLRNEAIEASISDVAPDGTLTLLDSEGGRRSFAFKEVEFVI